MMQAYTLTQLQNIIGEAVRRSPAGNGIWVTAELVDVRLSGGHCYMELVEKDSAGQTVAKLRANIWRNILPLLRKKFHDATGSDIVTGLKVMIGGIPTHHPLYGLSFNIRDIDPSYTLGDMERLRREILEALHREGVLSAQKELNMPAVPQRIAVISSAGAAGFGDFTDQLLNNAEGFVFYPCLFEAIMQGERTSESVREALQRIEESIDFWDCVVIIRGGGATTDLNGFDELKLARAVATFPIPIVVGIGHERDRTVLDEIANTRIKTPTGVAAFFVERARTWLGEAIARVNAITRYATDYLNGEKRALSQYAAIIPTLAGSRLKRAESLLQTVAGTLPVICRSHLLKADSRLQSTIALLPAIAGHRKDLEMQRLSVIESRCREQASSAVGRAGERLKNLESLVEAYSPVRTLERGYSITRDAEGRTIRDITAAKPGALITTEFASGRISSVVSGEGN